MLSLRRMKNITNPVFAEIFSSLKKLTHVDLSDCTGLLTTACNLMLDHNLDLEYVQLSGCNLGVDNKVVSNIAKLPNLSFLDLSYCKNFDDEGLKAFEGNTYPLESLIINGCNGISGPGLKVLLESFKETIYEIEAAIMDQESFSSAFVETLAHCTRLQLLDLTGSNGVGDDIMRLMA